MTRQTTPAAAAAITAPHIRMAVAVEIRLDGGTMRLTNAGTNIIFPDGREFFGIGTLGQVSAPEEKEAVEANGLTFALSGIQPEYVAIALGEPYQGRPIDAWTVLFDENMQPIPDPIMIFRGYLDTMAVTLGATAEIAVTAENRLKDLERPRIRRCNQADQLTAHPGDQFCKEVANMVNKELLWGKQSTK